MKLHQALKTVAIAIPGLVAMPVGASWTPSGGTTGFPPFTYSSDTSGYTEALFTEGVATTILHYSTGKDFSGNTYYFDNGSTANCTVYAESYTWDSTYSYGESYVHDTAGNDSFGSSYGAVTWAP